MRSVKKDTFSKKKKSLREKAVYTPIAEVYMNCHDLNMCSFSTYVIINHALVREREREGEKYLRQ